MSKRQAEDADEELDALKSGQRPIFNDGGAPTEEGAFEDEFEDEFESDDEIIEAGVDGRPDHEREAEEAREGGAMDVDQDTFIPGRHKLAAGEVLAPDLSTYEMLHTLDAPWPCLSLDIVRDALGDDRRTYPATVYAVAGTQAARGRERENQLLVMKMSGLSRMENGQDSDADSHDDDDDDEIDEPILETRSIPMTSCTNRVRTHQQPRSSSSAHAIPTTLAASMTEVGAVLIHDVTPHLSAFDTPGSVITPAQGKPLHTIRSHGTTEGYAVDWSPLTPDGALLTGDVSGTIYLTWGAPGGSFTTDRTPFSIAGSTIEELQWSPTERNVFASAGSDGTIRIWDTRTKDRARAAVAVRASQSDVNVLGWSRRTPHLLASGADDGEWAVWDLRQWKPSAGKKKGDAAAKKEEAEPSPVAAFRFHREQITCVEWHPTDDSTVLVAAGDSTLTLWDLAVELDDDDAGGRGANGEADVPPQLLFVHYMEQVKEAHWHPQIPGAVMATGGSGFGVFKTISI